MDTLQTTTTTKLSLWSRRIENEFLANFSSLNQIANNYLPHNVKNDIISQFKDVAQVFRFDEHFSTGELNCSKHWIISPFIFDLSKMPDGNNLKEDLIEMKSFQRLQLLFDILKLEDFWCAAMKAFSSLAVNAIRVVLSFPTTCFCKSEFSTMI